MWIASSLEHHYDRFRTIWTMLRGNKPVWPQFTQRLAWKLRPYFLRHPLPHDIACWRLRDANADDIDQMTRVETENSSWWKFLTPFFAAHGYHLYAPFVELLSDYSHPLPLDGHPSSRQTHPFARRLYSANKDCKFFFKNCIRGARDAYGRDVVIRIVSGPERSRELEILKRLTSSPALKDPRNITIPILDWLEFDGLTFIVMPRWDPAWIHDFGTVAECIHITDSFLAYLDFLHQHRIAHMDIHAGNMCINTIVPSFYSHLTGLRNPAVTRYAMIDFGVSYIYPYDMPLETVREELPIYAWAFHGLEDEKGPFNPFCADVGALGTVLDRHVRVIRDVVPEIVPFIESMTTPRPDDRPTAHEAYLKFQALKASLTSEQLQAPVTDLSYRGDGHYQRKYVYKKRPQLPDPDWSP
ncbi:hypothetical protein CVT24_012545 [Panaeolus cyanescens]|uniref:Protein kinase domain-containing protein n=1 Tax=Panaeolus cyanescens TaxID=181874 RepID=A0A409W626_9AGAR|nr:hypothetical protein CVT24_012545 [Panaeolus cyanescens]